MHYQKDANDKNRYHTSSCRPASSMSEKHHDAIQQKSRFETPTLLHVRDGFMKVPWRLAWIGHFLVILRDRG